MNKKKSFNEIDNPVAAQFISSTEKPEEIPENYKLNNLYIEKTNKRIPLLVQPSKHKRIKEAAASQNISMNKYINNAIDLLLKQDQQGKEQ